MSSLLPVAMPKIDFAPTPPAPSLPKIELPKDSQLEDDFREDYVAWKTDPTPANNTRMLRAISPVIDTAIAAHVGTDNPVLRGEARRMALDALPGYDPRKARLRTYLVNHLQSLKRFARRQTEPVPQSERHIYALRQLENDALELEDQIGREPTLEELSEHTHLSPDRILFLRRQGRAIAEGSFEQIPGGNAPGVRMPTQRNIALELLKEDLPPTDQKILEWTLGLDGKPPKSNQEIAARLGRTPGAISQRKALIQRQLEAIEAADLFGEGG